MAGSADTKASHPPDQRSIYVTLTLGVQGLLITGLILFILKRDWENVFLTIAVMLITLVPAVINRRKRIFIPPEFQFISVLFVFLSLYLGSGFDFYYKFWWWDLVLHTSSGFLLGIVGFIALFAINQTDHLPAGVKPSFLCFFGVTFAVTLGVVWEIFEFSVDRLWPSVNMQSNETGVFDTMKDLIVDTLGAVVVAFMAWGYLKTGRYSFLADGVRGFLLKNPRLLGQKAKSRD
jgi:hypothetical protein